MAAPKYDFDPLLPPGRRFLTLQEIKDLCVVPFTNISARQVRESRFVVLEGLVQRILCARLPCWLYVNGSLFTMKPEPDDLDIILLVDDDVMQSLSDVQELMLAEMNETNYNNGLDIVALTSYPVGHTMYGSGLDPRFFYEAYGLEHSRNWLKGYGVMRLLETDVGIRIHH